MRNLERIDEFDNPIVHVICANKDVKGYVLIDDTFKTYDENLFEVYYNIDDAVEVALRENMKIAKCVIENGQDYYVGKWLDNKQKYGYLCQKIKAA